LSWNSGFFTGLTTNVPSAGVVRIRLEFGSHDGTDVSISVVATASKVLMAPSTF
jgi:hypothetical protein